MSKLMKRIMVTAPAILLVLSSFSVADAAPPAGVCNGDGQHQEINAKRFSFKGLITGISSDAKTITLCGLPIDISNANVKGDVQAAKTNGWQVSAVGQLAGTAYKAQEVMVHSQGEPSGVTGKADDNNGTSPGNTQGAANSQGHGKGKGKGHDQSNSGSSAAASSNQGNGNGSSSASVTPGKSDTKDAEDRHDVSNPTKVSNTGIEEEQESSDLQGSASDTDLLYQTEGQRQGDLVTTPNQTGSSQGINQNLVSQMTRFISMFEALLASVKI
ncbi:MAG: hypothetical protein Q7R39_19065 [Dehalococcoidia bacterium]|nr:hypothetical protein [Dehalococcoidia bacterium]